MAIVDTRYKNALTIYEVADYAEGVDVSTATFLRLGKWIPVINNESEDIINEAGYYDGDGTAEETVDGTKEKYAFEGFYDSQDEAMALIASKKDQTGDGRKILLKVTDPDGTTEVGRATVTNIKFRGGNAVDYAPFNCIISRDEKPVRTEAAPVDPEAGA